jgi:pimeloyl-ACP methyl ester carboxylesterase
VFNHKNVRLVGDTSKHNFLRAKVYEVTAQLFVKKRKRPFFNPTTISVAWLADARDTAVPPVHAEFLHERLPKSKLDIIDAGHFTWEDSADEYAALVSSWWEGGYATAAPAKGRLSHG